MKEFLPILIGIIWLGYKMYKKNQEALLKQSQKRLDIPTETEADFATPQQNIDDLLKDLYDSIPLSETEELKSYQKVENKTVEDDYAKVEEILPQSKPIDYAIFDDAETLKTVEDDTYVSLHTQNIEKKAALNALQSNNDEKFIEEFDFEKAIIYSAILERPYSL